MEQKEIDLDHFEPNGEWELENVRLDIVEDRGSIVPGNRCYFSPSREVANE